MGLSSYIVNTNTVKRKSMHDKNESKKLFFKNVDDQESKEFPWYYIGP